MFESIYDVKIIKHSIQIKSINGAKLIKRMIQIKSNYCAKIFQIYTIIESINGLSTIQMRNQMPHHP